MASGSKICQVSKFNSGIDYDLGISLTEIEPVLARLSVSDFDQTSMMYFLDSRFGIDMKELQFGRTPLHIAVRDNKFDLARALLQSEANVDEYTNDNLTPLHIAVANREFKMVELLIKNKANVNPAKKFNGKTPLYIAVEYNCPEIVQLLLDNGASVEEATLRNTTLLHIAISKSTENVVKIILDRVSDLNVINAKDTFSDKTPLYLAIERKYHEVVRILLDKGASTYEPVDKIDALHFSVMKGDEKMVDLMLKHTDPDIRCRSVPPYYSLHYAIQRKYYKIASLLLLSGVVHVEERNWDGLTALHIAVESGNQDMVKLCLDHGADVNAKSVMDNWSVLFYAVKNLDKDMVLLLLNNGARVNDSIGWLDVFGVNSTVLDIAVGERCTWMITLLLEHGAIMNLSLTEECHNLCLEENMLLVKSVAQLVSEERCPSFKENMKKIEKNEVLREFYEDCQIEIEEMMDTKIIDNVSFYNLLVKDINALAAYARNQDLVKAFQKSDYSTKFPIYANSLKVHFVKGCVRRIMLDASLKGFGKVAGSTLPSVCTEEIMSYLNNQDLKNLISAAYDSGKIFDSFNRVLSSFLNSFKIFVE